MTADTQVAKTEPYEPPAKVEMQNYAIKWWLPDSLGEAMEFAEFISRSQGVVPDKFIGKPGSIVAAWSLGAPLGLSMLSSLKHIAVINGVPSIWGDGALAVCQAHPDWIPHEEFFEGEGDDLTAVCIVRRRGASKATREEFSVQDAKDARLWQGMGISDPDKRTKSPWVRYPKRMLKMRARGFALRDTFADALCGMAIAEEVHDITSEVTVVDTPPALPAGATATEKLKAKLRPAEPEPEPEDTGVDRAALEQHFWNLCDDRAGGDKEKSAKIAEGVLSSQEVGHIDELDDAALVRVTEAMEERLKQ